MIRHTLGRQGRRGGELTLRGRRKVFESNSSGDSTTVQACGGIAAGPFCAGTDAQDSVADETGVTGRSA